MPPKKRAPQPPLDEGDEVRYSLSSEVRQRGMKLLISFGSRTNVRAGETAEQAKQRLCRFVEDALDRKVNEFLEGS